MYCEGSSRKIHVEFGEVEAGAAAVKWIEIINQSCMEQTYEARRDAITNPLDHVFELCSYSWTLSPGQVYKCRIYYRPFVPLSINVDYFTIVDSVGERAEIKVRGTCIGPIISTSTTRLIMICTSENYEAKKRIKLVNDSKAMAIFMFDVDLTQKSFKIDEKQGYIGPRSRKYITITFAPQEAGIYTCHLPCLILNHRPIIIEVFGYYSLILHKANIQNRFNYPTRLKNSFEGYTSDTIVAVQDLPAISLSKNYIDFGQTNLMTENDTQKIFETLCLTNHTQSDVLIKWDQDIEKIFDITPAIVKVSAYQTVLFEITFNPNKRSNLFAREVVGYVFIGQQENLSEEIVFPAITSVRLIGNSFPICSDGWIPQYEIPHIVKMPPCLPSFPTYTTFLIKKLGHLPLMYHFVPPTSSHFVVKPMMGIIHENYQIIVVGMLPGIDNERVYVERWAIRFNGNTKSECFIDFRGFAECANVSFNDQNLVNFAPTFPNCRELQHFYMRNITRHAIKFEFVNMVPELRIQNEINKICPNDTVIHEWIFYPTTIGDYEFDAKCILIVLKDEIPVGPSVCVTLHIIGSCKTGCLVPGEENWMTLELRYILLGKTESKWDLDLGNNRHIFLLITIEGLSSSDNKLHLLNGTHFKFQHIYLGDKSPIYQVCWVHNGTNHNIPFSVNPRMMRDINQDYCYEVFSCATPHAIANPQSSVPILLKFQPRQFGIFKGKLCLTIDNKEEELILEGESSLPHKSAAIGEYMPSEYNFENNDNISVYFSTDCIDILHIPTHNHTVKMIMMYNNLVQDVLAFEWKRNDISGVIDMEVHPQKGVIKPMSVKSFRVTINTKEYPCVIDVNIPCEFINTSQRRAYQRSVYKLEDLSRELKGQFTITEKGISVPKPSMKVLEKPQIFYKAITIRCSIYSEEDKFLKISLIDELINAPAKEIYIEKNDRQILKFRKKDISRSLFIIEGLLWEIVNSKVFKNIMQDVLQNESNLFYSQFTMNLHERKKLVQRSYISPPRALINRILERMLFIIMHEEFALKTVHLIQHTDIRHKVYLNMVSGMNRRKTIKKETRLLRQDNEDLYVPSKSVSSSRISFTI